jgi:hypothetical protein
MRTAPAISSVAHLSMNPLAPARARRNVAVEAEGGQDQDARAARVAATIRLVASIPSSTGIRMSISTRSAAGAGLPRSRPHRRRLADDLGLAALEDLAQADPTRGLVVGDQDARHRTGRRTWTAKPPSARRPASRRPP